MQISLGFVGVSTRGEPPIALANATSSRAGRPEEARNLAGVPTVADRDDHAVREATLEEFRRATSDRFTLRVRV